MTQKRSKEFLDYIKDLVIRNVLLESGDMEMDPWLRRTQYVWVTELADALYAEGFLIDTVHTIYIASNEDKRPEQPSCTWKGFCFDESNRDYAFTAIWHMNLEKFLRNREFQHYYELTDLDLEPKEDYDWRQKEWYMRWKGIKIEQKGTNKR